MSDYLKEILVKVNDYQVKNWSFGSGKPKILITAGIHGNEPTSIKVALELIDYLAERKVKGTIEIIPLANALAFTSRKRSSIDGKDMNRIFPGAKEGTISEKIANYIWSKAKKMDYVLDLHCCGRDCSTYGLALHQDHEHSKKFVSHFPLDISVQSYGAKGQLFVEASAINIPAFIIELPGGGETGICPTEVVQETLETIIQGLNSLAFLSDIKPKVNPPKFYNKILELKSPEDGFFTPNIASGKEIEKGELLGQLGDFEIIAPSSGRIIRIVPEKFIFQGEIIAIYASDKN
ncbi:MAG: succinylglutamate desuccinylase/aspartoacylase family protein [Candidatus Kariarchaeaceae archaeon]